MRHGVSVAVVALAGLLLLAGCTSAPPRATTLPSGVTVSVFQNRTDYAPRHLEVQVHNASKANVTIRSGSFSSAYFVRSVAMHYLPYELEPGDEVAFPVYLPAAACTTAAPAPRVSLAFTSPGGKGTTTLAPAVLYHALSEIHSHDCAMATFERVVTITPGSAVTWTRDATGALVSHLELTLSPTGRTGTVILNSIDNTTLLDLSLNTTYPLELSGSSAPRKLVLSATPSRCETHVLSEDKVGTVVPFHVVTAAYPDGYFGLVLSNTLKFEYYHYFSLACGYSD
jgi:hypothetical protein